jgi:hypothetical protein
MLIIPLGTTKNISSILCIFYIIYFFIGSEEFNIDDVEVFVVK